MVKFQTTILSGGKEKVILLSGETSHSNLLAYCVKYSIKVIKDEMLKEFQTSTTRDFFKELGEMCGRNIHRMITGADSFNREKYEKLCSMKKDCETLYSLPFPKAYIEESLYEKAHTLLSIKNKEH